jgi:2-(1,2-epoxy-1,2-dihydrophenyl)acetyl-CoA isomerase
MDAYSDVEGLRVHNADGLLTLVLDRPQARGALTDTMTAGLIDSLQAAATDETLRAVLLRSSGEDFCSGFDVVARNAERGEAKPRTGSIQRRLNQQAHALLLSLLGLQLPVVAAVRGWAAGIGAQLMIGSDFAVVCDTTRVWYPFLERGFTPDSGTTWLLPRLVGPARARELLMLGRQLSGAEAKDWGLAHAVVPDGELDEVALALAQRLSGGPTVALGLTKMLMRTGADTGLASHLQAEALAMELSSRSPDFREGLRAMAERRTPLFGGS